MFLYYALPIGWVVSFFDSVVPCALKLSFLNIVIAMVEGITSGMVPLRYIQDCDTLGLLFSNVSTVLRHDLRVPSSSGLFG